jgi:Pentapeptide repeats (8 copies)
MEAIFRSWWQEIKTHPVATVLIALLAVVIVLVILIILGYIFNWGWTGLNATDFTSTPQNITRTIVYQPSKTLWDWLQLLGVLAVPVVVGFGAVWFTTRQGKVADAENTDNQREAALQAYIDKMSELLLEKNLRNSAEDDEVRKIARVRTLTILHRLDSKRKGNVLQFLHESKLINKDKRIIDLNGANLQNANLSGAELSGDELSGVDLSGADLSGAILIYADLRANLSLYSNKDDLALYLAGYYETNLSGADLSNADLRYANLDGANLQKANLIGAHLSGAVLSGAKVTDEQLNKAMSLKGTTRPDGSIHP